MSGHVGMPEQLAVGTTFRTTRRFTQSDFDRFAKVSGDDNPIHVDPAFAAQTPFGETVSHGMLLYACLCAAIGEHLPGARALDQDLMFPTGTPAGEAVEFRITVKAVDENAGTAELETLAVRPNGELGLQGRACVSFETSGA